MIHTALDNSTNIFGEDEKYWYCCKAGETIVKLLKKNIIPEGATIRIITHDFREDEWGFNTDWYKFAKRKLEDGINIKAYGGPGIQAHDAVKALMDLKMQVFITDATSGKGLVKEHYLTVDKPPIVWAEAEHQGPYAFGCFYTARPHRHACDNIDQYFKDIENQGYWLPLLRPL